MKLDDITEAAELANDLAKLRSGLAELMDINARGIAYRRVSIGSISMSGPNIWPIINAAVEWHQTEIAATEKMLASLGVIITAEQEAA